MLNSPDSEERGRLMSIQGRVSRALEGDRIEIDGRVSLNAELIDIDKSLLVVMTPETEVTWVGSDEISIGTRVQGLVTESQTHCGPGLKRRLLELEGALPPALDLGDV